MKRILLLLLAGMAITAHAQQVSFTLTQQPCNAGGVSDGILTSTFTGLTPPIAVSYYCNSNWTTQTTNTTTDVFNSFGGYVTVYALGSNNVSAGSEYYAPPLEYAFDSLAFAQCPNLSSASATVTSGNGPFTYEWYLYNNNSIVSTTNPTTLSNGFYGITVTDANGCKFGTAFGGDSLSMSSTPNFNLTVTSTIASCTNGTATVASINGNGIPPYAYQWSNGANTSSLSNLTMGAYNVTVTDAQGCSATGYTYVDQSTIINASVTPTAATCIQNNGSVIVFGSGGMPPYTYTWSNGPTTQNQSGIPGGWYNVVVTDANGCIGNGSAFVNTTTPITVTTSVTPSACTTATGSASLNITGGTAPYTTTWYTSPAQSGTTISNMAAGTYAFNIVDAAGCTQSGSVVIPPQSIITGTFSAVQPTCTAANGVLSIVANGGTAPYTYNWSNGSTSYMASNLAAGTHTVTITDNNGCSRYKYYLLEPSSPITLGTSVIQESCIYANDGSIIANATNGTAPYTYTWSNGGSGNTINGLDNGSYWVYVTDAVGCKAQKYSYVPYNDLTDFCYCTITGVVYEDLNGNCSQDAGENGIDNIQMHCSNFGYTYTDTNGIYKFKVPTGNYTLSQTVQTLYPLASCQNNSIAVSAVAASGCTQSFNFADIVTPLHDMYVSNWSYTEPVIGNIFQTLTILANHGTVPENLAIGSKQSDVQIGPPMFMPSSVYTTGTGGYSPIGIGALVLQPGDEVAINTNYQIPTNIPLGTLLTFKDSVVHQGPVSNWVNDYTPWDNVEYYNKTVVAAYDPNFKEVSPVGDGPNGNIIVADSVLEYNVHFQNLGTWQAQNIVVKDTLDADLDWKTLRPIYSSHISSASISEDGVLTYTFNNINLPAEMYNEPGSHGMFVYSIKTKKNLPMGTQFKNSAAIYFDYNAPVITNTTLNTLSQPTAVGEVTNKKGNGMLAVYPNPANSAFVAKVQAGDASELRVTDMQGCTVVSKQLAASKETRTISVDATSLVPGIYFVNHIAGNNVKTEKLVIMK